MQLPDEAIEAAAKALARCIAASDCLDADIGGYGWDADNPDHVAHFLPTATRKAAEQARIALTAAAPFIAAQALESVHALIRDLTDPDGCEFDHNGSCQAHGYFYLKPGEKCPQAEAKEWLADQEARSV